MPILAPLDLEDFAAAILESGGAPADEARIVAHSLVGANLRGHDSHGAMRVPFYLEQVERGDLVPGAAATAVSDTPTIVALDGGWGFGQVQMQKLVARTIDKAQQSGVAVGTLRSCGHIGRLGEYCEMAADAGLTSILMANTHGFGRRVAPPGGTQARLGTNPIALGAPAPGGPLIIDFGTSVTAEGKIRLRHIAGKSCPSGWLLDAQGEPTTDPGVLYRQPQGTILPFGGEQGFKGFGLGLLVEVFAGALSGGVCIREQPTRTNGNCVFFAIFDPRLLGGLEHFAGEVADLSEFVRNCPRAVGVEQIVLPGDPERRTFAERSRDGIPIDEGNWSALVKLAERLGVPVPAG